MEHTILIVEDDPSIQEILHDFIQEAGYDITLASDGVEALTKFSESHFDLILLDIMLPKIDGYSVSEVIRKKSDIPIIMLTALDSEEAQIRGLDLMVDDYITKPFSLPILIRKIAVLLRRSKVQKKVQEMSEIIHYQNITLDVDAYKAYINNTLIELTPREFEILQELVTHPGKILSRQYLLSRIWKYDYFGDERVIDTHIKNLRKKLKKRLFTVNWMEQLQKLVILLRQLQMETLS